MSAETSIYKKFMEIENVYIIQSQLNHKVKLTHLLDKMDEVFHMERFFMMNQTIYEGNFKNVDRIVEYLNNQVIQKLEHRAYCVIS